MPLRSKARWIAVFALLAVIAGAYGLTRVIRMEMLPVAGGRQAPDFTAFTLDSVPQIRTLHDYKGSVVMVNIWATWCGPCVIEMPSIEALSRDYAKKGLKILAVSIDGTGQEATIRQFVEYKQLTFTVLHDPDGRIQDTYQTTGVPETVIIGRDGTIRKRVIGAVNWNSTSNRAFIDQLLEEQSGT